MEVRINERVGKFPGRNYTHEEFMEASGTTAPGMTGRRQWKWMN